VAKKILQVELTDGLQPIWGIERYDWIHLLVRYRGYPLGWTLIPNNGAPLLSEEVLRYAISDWLGWDLMQVLMEESRRGVMPDSVPARPISVVVCTRDRAQQLEQCLQALGALDYPDYEVIVVDNAPSDEDTAQLVARFPVRYVREQRPGLDWARNCGIGQARHDIVAFTDDDVRPDRQWLRAINAAFADPKTMAVTGMVAPAELETTAQIYYELGYGGMMPALRRRVFHLSLLSTRDLLWASNFGAGANMAFRRELFAAIGRFDVALDVGTPSGSGGDLEMCHRLVAAGHTLVYDPRVLVWHHHRRDFASLSRQLQANGLGFGSYLLTCARNRTASRLSILRFGLVDWLGGWILRRLLRPGWFPRRLVVAELLGALRSPRAYRAAQARAKQVAASFQTFEGSQSHAVHVEGQAPEKPAPQYHVAPVASVASQGGG
jgi:glycosyltransferase involved in cell wall biosynthesis